MPGEATKLDEPQTMNISAVVPRDVGEAVKQEARDKDRSMSWVIGRVLLEWYAKRPGAQAQFRIVADNEGEE